jgi:hypothetical protein
VCKLQEVHSLAATFQRAALCELGVLRQPGLEPSSVDEDVLLHLSRRLVDAIGLPEKAMACSHPPQLLDSSSNHRCLVPFRVLAVAAPNSCSASQDISQSQRTECTITVGAAAHPLLSFAETSWITRSLDESTREMKLESVELEKVVAELTRAEVATATWAAERPAGGDQASASPGLMEETIRLRRRRETLELSLQEQSAKRLTAHRAMSEWEAHRDAAEGATRQVPIFPIGDSLVRVARRGSDGLDANLAFHTALDAAHAVRVLSDEGLQASLIDRQFAYGECLQLSCAPSTMVH